MELVLLGVRSDIDGRNVVFDEKPFPHRCVYSRTVVCSIATILSCEDYSSYVSVREIEEDVKFSVPVAAKLSAECCEETI